MQMNASNGMCQKSLKETIEEMELDFSGMKLTIAEWVKECKAYRAEYSKYRHMSRMNPTDEALERVSRRAYNRFNQTKNTIINFIRHQLSFFGLNGNAIRNFNIAF